MGARTKIHHYVPRVLQKAFCDSNWKIWFCEREDGPEFTRPELRNTRSTFKEREYYSVLSGSGALSDVVERKFYGKIENYLGQVLPVIEHSFDHGRTPTFSGDSLISLQLVVYEMLKRSPDYTSEYDDVELGREVVRNTINAIEEANQDTHQAELAEMQEALGSQSRLRAFGRNIRVRSVIDEPSPRITDALAEFSVRWARSRSKPSFVLSSRMVYRIGNGGSNGLDNPNMEIWMPVSPKTALVLLRDKECRVPLEYEASAGVIRSFNEHAVRTSRQLGSHSEKLLTSLTRTKNRWRSC